MVSRIHAGSSNTLFVFESVGLVQSGCESFIKEITRASFPNLSRSKSIA
jgi:hypothetical protein